MKYSKVKKLVEGITENEFRHIQECFEMDFVKSDSEFKKDSAISQELYKKLEKNLTDEQRSLLDDLCSSLCNEHVTLCRFYFKEGLKAGLDNLKFLNAIGYIESIL